jgi:hypothetical protein
VLPARTYMRRSSIGRELVKQVSESQLAVQAETHELKRCVVGLAVDVDETGADVAVAEILSHQLKPQLAADECGGAL